MWAKIRFLVGGFTVVTLLLFGTGAFAEWRVDLESKTVEKNQTGVSVAIAAFWDIEMGSLTVPVIVRSTSGGAFWSPPLPVDAGDDSIVGVRWNWSNPGWAILVEEVRPGLGCDPAGDVGYDGTSPDHFVINAGGVGGGTAPEPSGRDVVVLTINVNGNAGNFEFDTACYTKSLDRIYMIDNVDFQDHGPAGIGDFSTFNKGVITITEPACFDSCWVARNVFDTLGATLAVQVTFENCVELAAVTIPLTWTPDAVTLEKVDFTGSRVEYVTAKSDTGSINNEANTVLLSAVVGAKEHFIAPGKGLFATLNFRIDEHSADTVIIDTTWRAGSYEFIDTLRREVPTGFVPGSIILTPAK